MKTLFIEAKKKLKLNKKLFKELEASLPPILYIVYSIQYKELAEQLKRELKGKKIIGFSQVLGCSKIKTEANTILLVGSGRFHALNLAIYSGKPIVIFDNYSISRINDDEIQEFAKKEKGKYLRFLSSKRIGILVSSKPGQSNLPLALKLKNQLGKDKEAFLFLADNVNLFELENFPCEIFINTACPGLSLDSPRIINARNLVELSSL